MPPKRGGVLRRPGARLRPKAAPKPLPKGAARVRVRLRRPGAAPSSLADPWEDGEELASSEVRLDEWKTGTRILVTEGYYYGQKVILCGEVMSTLLVGGQVEVSLMVLGSPEEEIVKWVTSNPGIPLKTHLCPRDCPLTPDGEGVLHAMKVKLLVGEPPGWSYNLKETADELPGLRTRQKESERERAKEEEKKTKEKRSRSRKRRERSKESKRGRRKKEDDGKKKDKGRSLTSSSQSHPGGSHSGDPAS